MVEQDLTDAIRPVERETLNSKIYLELRRALIRGAFSPGQTLKTRQLASAFRTSTTPVREALGRLAAERALFVTPSGAVQVPHMTREKFADLTAIRVSVEGIAAERAAARIGRTEISALEELCARMETAVIESDHRSYLEYNEKFHFILYRSAKSDILLDVIEMLWLQVGPYFTILIEDFIRNSRHNVHHLDTVKALRARDGAKVRGAIERDISWNERDMAKLRFTTPSSE